MKIPLAAFAALALCVVPAGALAQDARYLAGACANCHGTDGHASRDGAIAPLAGMQRAYFIEQMSAFRTGARPATVMHQLSRGFTEEQIFLLADYFSTR